MQPAKKQLLEDKGLLPLRDDQKDIKGKFTIVNFGKDTYLNNEI